MKTNNWYLLVVSPTPVTLPSGGSLVFPLVVHQPASLSQTISNVTKVD